MKIAKYIRTSTLEQSTLRQENTSQKTYIDKCSGSIPFNERPSAIKLLNDISAKKVETLHVHSIDRLGRNAYDIQTTLNTLNKSPRFLRSSWTLSSISVIRFTFVRSF